MGFLNCFQLLHLLSFLYSKSHVCFTILQIYFEFCKFTIKQIYFDPFHVGFSKKTSVSVINKRYQKISHTFLWISVGTKFIQHIWAHDPTADNDSYVQIFTRVWQCVHLESRFRDWAFTASPNPSFREKLPLNNLHKSSIAIPRASLGFKFSNSDFGKLCPMLSSNFVQKLRIKIVQLEKWLILYFFRTIPGLKP